MHNKQQHVTQYSRIYKIKNIFDLFRFVWDFCLYFIFFNLIFSAAPKRSQLDDDIFRCATHTITSSACVVKPSKTE